jgi:hypothetical protein
VITSRWDLADIEVAYRMFERWRQENFFKYLREKFQLDAPADYQVGTDDPTRTVPNLERRGLDNDIRNVRAAAAKLEQAYGAAVADSSEQRQPTMRGFKIAHSQIEKQLRDARKRLTELLTRRRTLPQRVEVGDLSDGAVVKLATERKHLTNLIKMVTYQTESDLLTFLRPHYARSGDEGRTLLHEFFPALTDIDVTDTKIQITICPFSSPHDSLPWISPHDALHPSSSAADRTSLSYTTAQTGAPARPVFRHLKPDISRAGLSGVLDSLIER